MAPTRGRQAAGGGTGRVGESPAMAAKMACHAKVDVRLPVQGNANPHGARPVHLIITMIKRIRTSRLYRRVPVGWEGARAVRVECLEEH